MATQQIELIADDPRLRPESDSVALMRILERALHAPDFDIAKMNALLEMKERWDKGEARKAYVRAMNAFKANPPAILKNKHVHFDTQKGTTDYDHATLDHVCEQVTKGLSTHGISHNWKLQQFPDGKVKVTCILTHEQGHSEDGSTLEGMPDLTGSKNAIQAIGSAVTYLQRYTLLSATGLAAKNQDTDGKVAGKPAKGVDNLEERLQWINSCRNNEELRKQFQQSYKVAEDLGDASAIKAIIQAKNARWKELNPKVRGA